MRAIDDEKIHNYYNKLSNITIKAHILLKPRRYQKNWYADLEK